MEQKLVANHRTEKGKTHARQLRRDGRVPAVLYGHSIEPVPLDIDGRELYKVLHTDAGQNVLIDLEVDGEVHLALAREIDRDHIKNVFVHVDFLVINRDETIVVQVPIRVVGESRGIHEGGILETHTWELEVECLPGDVPEAIDIDITEVELHQNLHVSDIIGVAGVTIKTDPDVTILAVVPPQKPQEAEEVAVEGEEGAEGAEGAEGEAASEGDES